MKTLKTQLRLASLLSLILLTGTAYGQLTPSGDAYTNTADPTTNYGAQKLLDVESASQTTYIQFNLSSLPSGYTGADITKATLKLYVNAVTKAGSFNVDYVNGTWSEGTIDANNAPALGSTIAASIPLITADKNQYILIDITAAVQAWLNGTETNDGIALVGNSPLNASFDSKENTTTSHPVELDIVFAGGGTITGVTTASGSGLTGGGTSGTLNLSLLTSCSNKQVLQWSGTAWACSNAGTGTITGVTAGTDLTGGGTSGNVTLNLDTTKVPQLSSNNAFTANNAVSVNNSNPGLTLSNTGGGDGMDVYATSGATGIYESGGGIGVFATGGDLPLVGQGGAAEGVYGESATDSNFTPAIFGVEKGSTTKTVGVLGETESPNGAGVYGQISNTQSGMGSLVSNGGGVWGDAGSATNGAGVLGTADNEDAAAFYNKPSFPDACCTVFIANESTTGYPLWAYNASNNGCYIDPSGDINCTGSKNAVVPIDGGQRKVALSAIESPKNWFEDFGSEQLSNGAALIALEPEFVQTVNTDLEYHVFLTPKGDCKGLYVANESASSFEVHELGRGSSSVRFDYRIVALRKNFENIRLADHTNDPDPIKMMKKGTPTHFDGNRLIPPKREAQSMRPGAQSIAQPAKK
ncbi:MAG: DNRLRE domain-containing protein [Terriglobales bacterium]